MKPCEEPARQRGPSASSSAASDRPGRSLIASAGRASTSPAGSDHSGRGAGTSHRVSTSRVATSRLTSSGPFPPPDGKRRTTAVTRTPSTSSAISRSIKAPRPPTTGSLLKNCAPGQSRSVRAHHAARGTARARSARSAACHSETAAAPSVTVDPLPEHAEQATGGESKPASMSPIPKRRTRADDLRPTRRVTVLGQGQNRRRRVKDTGVAPRGGSMWQTAGDAGSRGASHRAGYGHGRFRSSNEPQRDRAPIAVGHGAAVCSARKACTSAVIRSRWSTGT